MSSHETPAKNRPPFDPLLQQIADYVCDFKTPSDEALNTARYCLMDTLGCGFLALKFPACTKLLGPVVPGTVVPNGAKVPGVSHQSKLSVPGGVGALFEDVFLELDTRWKLRTALPVWEVPRSLSLPQWCTWGKATSLLA